MIHRCDIGGDYIYPPDGGPAIPVPFCGRLATYTYRSINDIRTWVGYRCTDHAAWLSTDHCIIEPINQLMP